MKYQYPLHLRFKLIALAPRITVTDAAGQELLYVHQKTLAFKEDVQIFSNSSKTDMLYRIRADRVIDFSAQYNFKDRNDQPIGSIKHKGFRSIWKATYLIMDADGQQTHHVSEGNPWVKVADMLLGEIPVVGLFSGYLFHPQYFLYDSDNEQPVFQLTKNPGLFESTFEIVPLAGAAELSRTQEERLLLALLMMVQLERSRG
jgi:hypothetical protein